MQTPLQTSPPRPSGVQKASDEFDVPKKHDFLKRGSSQKYDPKQNSDKKYGYYTDNFKTTLDSHHSEEVTITVAASSTKFEEQEKPKPKALKTLNKQTEIKETPEDDSHIIAPKILQRTTLS
jgi:hypothetical protein